MKKRLLSMLLALALLCACLRQFALPVNAATSGYCGDNLPWRFDEKTGKLTITGSGDMYNFNFDGPWESFQTKITSVSLPNGLTSIGDSAFTGCSSLTKVTIPNSVINIGDFAFSDCSSLTSITIPDSVTEIGWYAFSGCSSLEDISFPDSVKEIGDNPFSGTAYFDDENNWADGLLYVDFLLIGAKKSISAAHIRPGTKIIDAKVFEDCTALKSVSFPDSLICIKPLAFKGCSSLTSVVIPENVKSLVWGVFKDCKKLTVVTIQSKDCTFDEDNGEYSVIDYDYGKNELIIEFGETLGKPGRTVIRGYAGSTAEKYAKKYGYEFNVLPETTGFADVPAKAFYSKAVDWAMENGVTNGIDATHFGPEQGCTRGQVVTFLWRAAGCPEPTSKKNPFRDVKQGAFYYKAVLWAVDKGITKGTSTTTFSPNATCTRGQIVTFLYRFKGSSKAVTASNPFKDVSKTAFYYPAMLWAVEYGVTNGVSEQAFAPGDTCTRGQVVTFLYRASQNKPSPKFKKENYEIVIGDAAWDKALAAAKKKGGKLACFESQEEYRFVLELIGEKGKTENVYYSLGGRRDAKGKDYFWADENNKLYGKKLNGSGAWCAGCWEPGEPNLEWNSRQEDTLMMYYSTAEARWAWYDGSGTYRNPNRTYGYIIEYGG